ncbi:MAG: hypothetical protein AAFX87_02355 [Bacteroidota bacterium]
MSIKLNRTILFLAKLLILVWVITFIYFKLNDIDNLDRKLFDQFIFVNRNNGSFALILPILLMPINWLLEAIKWKILASKIQKIDLFQAYSGVLVGLSLSFITPHGIGDYAGRIWSLNATNRNRLLGSILVGRWLQMLATLLFGTLGVYYLFPGCIALILIVSFIVLVIALCLKPKVFINALAGIFRSFSRLRVYRWISYYFSIIKDYTRLELLTVGLLSVIRYCIFAFQFFWILTLFEVALPADIKLAGVSWIFLAKSILPSFNFLSDLGIREFAAIQFFEQYAADNVDVIASSLFLWLINILVPTLLGLIFVFKLRFIRAK